MSILCRFEVGGSQVENCFKLGKKLAPKAHVQVKFCSDPVRSENYFPELKPAFSMPNYLSDRATGNSCNNGIKQLGYELEIF